MIKRNEEVVEEIDFEKIEKLKNLKPLNILTGDSAIYFELLKTYKDAFPDYNTVEVFTVEDIKITKPLFDIEQFLCIIRANSVDSIKKILEFIEDKDYILPVFITNSVDVFNYIKNKKFTADFNGYFPPYKLFARYCVKNKQGMKDEQIENLYLKLKGDYSQLDLILAGVAKPQKRNISFNRLFFSLVYGYNRKRCVDLLYDYRHAKKFVLETLIKSCDKTINGLLVENEEEFDVKLENVPLERVIELRCELEAIKEDRNNYNTWIMQILKLM